MKTCQIYQKANENMTNMIVFWFVLIFYVYIALRVDSKCGLQCLHCSPFLLTWIQFILIENDSDNDNVYDNIYTNDKGYYNDNDYDNYEKDYYTNVYGDYNCNW